MDVEEASREERALRSLHDLLMAVSQGRDLRFVLQRTAEGVVEALGFDLTVVNYLHDDGYLEIMAVAGDAAAQEAMHGRRVRVEEYLEEFELADEWGSLRFVPHDRLPADAVSSWVPEVLPLDLPDAWHPMDALHAPLRGPEGELVGVLGVDLPRDGRRPGELKRQVLEMYAAQAGLAIHVARGREREQLIVEELRALGRYRDEVNLALTHELKNPLTAILGHVQLLLEDGSGSPSLDSIERAAERMSALVANLLLLGRVQDPTPELPQETVDLDDVVREAASHFAVQAARGDVEVHVEVTGRPLVVGDADELLMLVTNLLSNAVKFTPPGGSVVLDLHVDEQTGPRAGQVVLTCADTGHGIPEQEQEAVFEVFTRSSSVETRATPGSGLGLSICQRIVVRHGGSIDLTSVPGRGTTVTVRLPAAG